MVGFHTFGSFCAGLDDIRVNGALAQEIDPLQLSCLFLKHTDEFSADDLTLFLRICNAVQLSKEPLCRVHIDQICVQLVAEYLYHALRLVLTH